MVHVVVAGGAGNVGREIVDELVAQGKNQITVFSEKSSIKTLPSNIKLVKLDYHDKAELVSALHGVHTVLSFISSDPNEIAQKTLIAACIEAGVKRFAPSEWATISNSGFPGYAFKDAIHEHLRSLNSERTVLEYTLFQPGMFMNYLVYPHNTATTLYISCVGYDIESGNAVLVDDGSDNRVYTTIKDTAKVVAAAIDYEGRWPEIGGIVGERIAPRDVVKLLDKYTGTKMQIHTLKKADLAKGEWNSSWTPPFDHPNMPAQYKTPEFGRMIHTSFQVAASNGAADVSDEWNRLLPDYKFTGVEAFLKAGVSDFLRSRV